MIAQRSYLQGKKGWYQAPEYMPAVPVVCKSKSDGSGMSVAPVKGPKAGKTRKRSKASKAGKLTKNDQKTRKQNVSPDRKYFLGILWGVLTKLMPGP